MIPTTLDFATRLATAVKSTGNPICVGIDPRVESLPTVFAGQGTAADLGTIAERFWLFSKAIIDIVAGKVPVVKPQAAFFEQLGPAGMIALEKVIRYAQEKLLLVILDGKRNDIGTTAEAYAEAYLAQGVQRAWGADSLTVSPYLGADSLDPFVRACTQYAAGIFVLVKTSNPGGGYLQDLEAQGRSVYQHVAELVEKLNADRLNADGFGPIGSVVGATYPGQLEALRAAMKSSWILVPGFGAQGGTAKDARFAFREDGLGAVINSSRGIIFAHQRKEFAGAGSWERAVELAVQEMQQQLSAETPVGKWSGA